jgi:hypothetical protein
MFTSIEGYLLIKLAMSGVFDAVVVEVESSQEI